MKVAKQVLVTGAGAGIGRAIAHGLAQRGAKVGVLDWSAEAAEQVVLEIKRDCPDVAAVPMCADVADYAAVSAAIENNPEAVADYQAGEDGALNFLVGQVMQETEGRADPSSVNERLRTALEE